MLKLQRFRKPKYFGPQLLCYFRKSSHVSIQEGRLEKWTPFDDLRHSTTTDDTRFQHGAKTGWVSNNHMSRRYNHHVLYLTLVGNLGQFIGSRSNVTI